MKTRAAILREIGNGLVIEELEFPALREGQVLVEISYSGFCGKQLNEIKGYYGEDKYLPHTLGHEGSGIVQEVGSRVTTVKPGDYVVLTWIKGKGTDATPCKYKTNRGEIINSGQISTFSKHSIISENRMVKVPKELPPPLAPPIGCAIPTGVGMINNTLKVAKGSTIAIFGVGGVGLSAVIGASLAGCARIIAVDIHQNKLELAKELGATDTVNAKKDDPVSRVKELTNGKGVDYSVEASGTPQVMEMAYEAVGTPGKVVLAGNVKRGEKISIDPYDLLYDKKLLGTSIGETYKSEEIPRYAEMYLAGQLKLDKLITHKYKFEDINQFVIDLEEGKVGRGVIEL